MAVWRPGSYEATAPVEVLTASYGRVSFFYHARVRRVLGPMMCPTLWVVELTEVDGAV